MILFDIHVSGGRRIWFPIHLERPFRFEIRTYFLTCVRLESLRCEIVSVKVLFYIIGNHGNEFVGFTPSVVSNIQLLNQQKTRWMFYHGLCKVSFHQVFGLCFSSLYIAVEPRLQFNRVSLFFGCTVTQLKLGCTLPHSKCYCHPW